MKMFLLTSARRAAVVAADSPQSAIDALNQYDPNYFEGQTISTSFLGNFESQEIIMTEPRPNGTTKQQIADLFFSLSPQEQFDLLQEFAPHCNFDETKFGEISVSDYMNKHQRKFKQAAHWNAGWMEKNLYTIQLETNYGAFSGVGKDKATAKQRAVIKANAEFPE